MSKKIFLGIVILLLLFGHIVSNASNNIKITINAEQKDKIITVTVKTPKIDEGIDALAGKIEYDNSKLKLIEAKSANSNLQEPSINLDNGKFTILIKSNSLTTSTDIIKFSFKIKDNVTGKTEIKISQLTGATSNDKKVVFADSSTDIIIKNNNINNKNDTNNGNQNNQGNSTNKDNSSNNNNNSSSSSSNSNNSNSSNKENTSNNNKQNTSSNNVNTTNSNNSLSNSEVKTDNNIENNNTINNIVEENNTLEIGNTQNNTTNNNVDNIRNTIAIEENSSQNNIEIYLYIIIGAITLAIIVIIIILVKIRKSK